MAPVVVVERSSTIDAEVFRHRDLHVLDELPVPDRLHERVGEAEEEEVLDRVLSQVVIDAKDGAFVEGVVNHTVQVARGGQVAAEGFLDDDPALPRRAAAGELLQDKPEQSRRDGQVVHGTDTVAERLGQLIERGSVAVVAIDVRERRSKLVEDFAHESAAPLDALERAGAELIERPSRFGDRNDAPRQIPVQRHPVQCGKDLLVREIARRSVEHERIRWHCSHHATFPSSEFDMGVSSPRSRDQDSVPRGIPRILSLVRHQGDVGVVKMQSEVPRRPATVQLAEPEDGHLETACE